MPSKRSRIEWFFIAVELGDVERVARFVARGMPLDSRDVYGNTALMVAAAKGCTPLLAYLLGVGANVALANNAGVTARLIAKRCGHVESWQILERVEFSRREKFWQPLVDQVAEVQFERYLKGDYDRH